LLSWFATCWFCSIDHSAQIEAGILDPVDDAIFDPRFVLSYPGSRLQFPLWLSRPIQGYFRKLYFDRHVIDLCVSHLSGRDSAGVHRGLAWIMLNDEKGLVSRSAMRPQQFDVGVREATEEIAIIGLRDTYEDIVDGVKPAISVTEIRRILQEFYQTHEVQFAFYGGLVKL